MTTRRNVIVLKQGGIDKLQLFEKIVAANYKTPVDCVVTRGSFVIKTELAISTVLKLFPDWEIKHQTKRRVVLQK